MHTQRVVTTLSELDEILGELDTAAQTSDDELRRVFATFSMATPLDLPSDPYSPEYRDRQFRFYEHLAGRAYSNKNEVSSFDVASAAKSPFPYYTESCLTVGNHVIAIGHVLKTMNLRPKARVLEFGPGWGNTTLALASMGHSLLAVDVEPNFVELIKERSRRLQVEVEVQQGDFQLVHTLDRKFDAVLFFECFHHCSDHHSLIAGLAKVVAEGGQVVFAAEPITDDFPIPWGFRLDGESLWAIRKHGWCELGFKESYFRDLLGRHGWLLTKHVCADTPWGTVFVARRFEKLLIEASDPRLQSVVGLQTAQSIESRGKAGVLMHGPYIPMAAGSYRVSLFGTVKNSRDKKIRIDAAVAGGSVVIAESRVNLHDQPGRIAHFDFTLEQPCMDLEIRLFVGATSAVTLSRLEIELAPWPAASAAREKDPLPVG